MKIRTKVPYLFHVDWEEHPFLYGLFSLGDLGGNNSVFDEPSKSDAEFLKEDWARIGDDMRKAMCLYRKEVGLC